MRAVLHVPGGGSPGVRVRSPRPFLAVCCCCCCCRRRRRRGCCCCCYCCCFCCCSCGSFFCVDAVAHVDSAELSWWLLLLLFWLLFLLLWLLRLLRPEAVNSASIRLRRRSFCEALKACERRDKSKWKVALGELPSRACCKRQQIFTLRQWEDVWRFLRNIRRLVQPRSLGTNSFGAKQLTSKASQR